jgi:chorismate-pyruvate lyase
VLTPDAADLPEVFHRMGTNELLKDRMVQRRYRIVHDGTSNSAGELG